MTVNSLAGVEHLPPGIYDLLRTSSLDRRALVDPDRDEGGSRANHVIHIAAVSQLRLDSPGRAHDRRKLAAGKTPMEAMRCLKRRISDAIYRQLVADTKTAAAADMDADPGGHHGAALPSSAAGFNPHTGTSDQPQPGPAARTLPAAGAAGKTTGSKTLQPAS